jgi:hypothetical protein
MAEQAESGIGSKSIDWMATEIEGDEDHEPIESLGRPPFGIIAFKEGL